MADWKKERAHVTVDAGEGWMSRFELEGLRVGSIVRSQTEAGWSQRVELNGKFLARASIIIVGRPDGTDERLCARIDDMRDEDPRPEPQERGDGLLELLPFAIRVAALDLAMEDLEGAGPRSLINLDRNFSMDEDAELVVAGVPAARGKVAVIGECLGIRVTALLVAPGAGSPPRTTGAAVLPGYAAERVKDYNFKMPDCFTKRAIDRAAEIHLEFLRGLEASGAGAAGFRLARVDQLTYGEWCADPGRAAAVAVMTKPAGRRRDYEREAPGGLPPKLLVQAGDARLPLGAERIDPYREWIAQSAVSAGLLPLVVGFDAAGSAALEADPLFALGFACLRGGWMRVADLRIGQGAGGEVLQGPPPAAEGAVRWEMILLARFEATDGKRMDIVYPLALLEPYLPVLGR